MWQNLTPQQQQFLMSMLMGRQGGTPMLGAGQATMGMIPGVQSQGLNNPLMLGGNSAVNPQQQAMMQQYLALMNHPQGWGATANSNVPVWQLMMGRSPMYGTGTAVP